MTSKSERKEFWQLLLKLALPIALQHLLINSLTFIDTFFMSQLGDIELAASGMATQWNWLLSMATFGLCSGTALFVAQYWGARKISGIHTTYSIASVTSLSVSMLFFVLAILIPEKIISVFNKDPEIIKCGAAYLSIVCFSYPATVLNSVLSTVLRSTERVRLPMLAAIVSTSLNAVLDYALMFGAFGLPAMGVRGAALATAISAWVGLAVVIVISVCQKNILCIAPRKFFSFGKLDFINFMKKASPVIFNELLWGLGTVTNNAIYSNTGYENYAACTILRTIESLGLILFIGLNDGGAVIIGKTVGEGKYAKAYTNARRLVITVPLISLVIGMAVIALRTSIIHVFNMSGNISDVTLGIASVLVIIYALELCIRNIPYTLVCAVFRSGGDSLTGAKFDIICLWALAIPTTFVCAYWLDIPFWTVFLIGYLVEDIPKAVMCLKHFFSRKWIKPVVNKQ